MPPRTGPRRRKRVRQAPLPERHFTIVHGAAWVDAVTAHRIELDDGHLVLRDQDDAIVHIVARGHWQEIRPGITAADLLPEVLREPEPTFNPETREQATLAGENDPLIPPEEDKRFAPSSPEEAQRILMEIHRRISPDHQDPPDAATPPARPKE
jgi:hypothetical protein